MLPSGKITREAWKSLILQLDPDDEEKEQKVRMELEKRSARELRRAFNDQLDGMFDGLDEESPVEVVREKLLRDARPNQRVKDALARALHDSVDLGVNVAFDQFHNVGMGFDYTLVLTEARDWALQYSGMLITRIDSTTQTQVQQAVSRWFSNGDPLSQLRKDLAPTFGPKRAQLIAQTETTRAAAEGQLISYRTSGVVERSQWFTVNDERVCPVCGALHGKETPLGQQFEGGYFPPAHPGCRCFILPVISEVA